MDTLRTANCPRCNYSRRGLPDAGKCPECGLDYSPESLILFGWAFGEKASILTSRRVNPGLLVWIGAFLLIFLGNFMSGWHDLTMYGFALFALGAASWGLYRRFTHVHQKIKPLQFHIRSDGFATTIGFHKIIHRHSWSEARDMEIWPIREGLWRLQIGKSGRAFTLQSPLVEFEFEADEGTVTQLKSRIERLSSSTNPPIKS